MIGYIIDKYNTDRYAVEILLGVRCPGVGSGLVWVGLVWCWLVWFRHIGFSFSFILDISYKASFMVSVISDDLSTSIRQFNAIFT